ncbi:MAG: alginate lyase family protein [Paraglaciecola sp.]|uniref:alginate lyase family protein n=3 Tax=Paraglaciecola sp. TaxID=1920173 RepID=UPI003263F0A0
MLPSRLVLGLCLVAVSIRVFSGPLVMLEMQDLSAVKTHLQNQTAATDTLKAYELLIKRANDALYLGGYSVVDKSILPPSNDPHDYLSISRYWWPDSSISDGLPWVRRDGITNPDTQTDSVDRKRLGAMAQSVQVLALAYYFSGDEKYALKGTELIRRWFLKPETKMNPHLEFAQSVPGKNIRRRSGILDGRLIPAKLLDGITLLSSSSHWSKQNDKEMNLWLNSYLNWLTNSELGREGAKQTNNHGSWYYYQVAALSWYLGDNTGLAKAVQNTKEHMLQQFDEQGAQHHELARTRPYFYSCFNLEALTNIAAIAKKVNIDLWEYATANQGILKTAVEYLIPAAKGEPWPHGNKAIKATDLIEILDRYNQNSGEPSQQTLLTQLLQQAKASKGDSTMYYQFVLLNPQALLE